MTTDNDKRQDYRHYPSNISVMASTWKIGLIVVAFILNVGGGLETFMLLIFADVVTGLFAGLFLGATIDSPPPIKWLYLDR